MSKKINPTIQWFIPGRKKTFAYSTQVVSDRIVAVSQGLSQDTTIIEFIKLLGPYDFYEKEIIQKIIDLGHGDLRLKDFNWS